MAWLRVVIAHVIRPFPSSAGPLYQNEVKCSSFDMEMICHSHANRTYFHKKRLCTWPHFESVGLWNSEVAELRGVIQPRSQAPFLPVPTAGERRVGE